jgi:hypothetical protein
MTEAEWLACDDPRPMLESLLGDITERKLRLFACACCRRIGHLFIGRRCWWAIEVCERHADGSASDAELSEAGAAASQAFIAPGVHRSDNSATALAASAVWGATAHTSDGSIFAGDARVGFAINTAIQAGDAVEPQAQERRFQSDLLRDIFGNPFRPVAFAPGWRTDTVVALAKQMYDAREFGTMPILADALQDAGCDRDDVLSHCRGPGPHVRGCWVVDLVLGKE